MNWIPIIVEIAILALIVVADTISNGDDHDKR